MSTPSKDPDRPVLEGETDGAKDPEGPSFAEVKHQLERILADRLFQGAQRLTYFLRFAVESVIVGKTEQLKESVIGIEVFERGISYSPQEDPIVRVMAGRLRGKLAEYYQSSGSSDLVLIELPRGGYVPRFGWREPSKMQPAAGAASATAGSRSVGREQELARLHSALASAVAGTRIMLTISGETGIGKTTLAEDFLADVEQRGATAWIGCGRCSERLAQSDAFVPILECLESLLRGASGDQVAQALKAAAPSWYLQVAPPSDESVARLALESKTTSHERMRREFASFFEELSGRRPIILFLDDMHWADWSSCDLVAYLAASTRNIRLLVLMTHRPAELLAARRHPFLPLRQELSRRGVWQEMPLSFLSLSDIERYIAMQYPGNLFPAEFARIVHQRTEGNPLFMTEMLRFLREQGTLALQHDHWELEQPTAKVSELIPVGIQSMIQLKIGQLSPEDVHILLCAAVQGVQFHSAVVAEVLLQGRADVEERLQSLDAEHNFVAAVGEQEFPNQVLSVRYRFVHVFYQNAFYGSLTASRRAEHSRAIARVLVHFSGESSRSIAADLALLFETGRDHSGAARYFLQAARNAARLFAYREAAALCERGLRALANLPPSRERDAQELQFTLVLGMSLMVTRGYADPDVEKIHSRSRELCLALDDRRRLPGVLWSLHTRLVNAGELLRALEVAREMRRVADSSGDPISILESLHALGTTLAFMGRLLEARREIERAFAIYPVSGHVLHPSLYVMDPCVTCLSMLARLLTFMGCLEEASHKAAESIDLSNRLAHPPSLVYANFWMGWVHEMRGEHGEGICELESVMALSRENGMPLFLEWARVVRGSALTHVGRTAEGISEIRKSLERQQAMGAYIERGYCLTLLAEALGAEGAREEALGLCDEALEFGIRTEGRCYEAETHRVRGEVLLGFGDDARLPEVECEFQNALDLARQTECLLIEMRAAGSYFRLRRRMGDSAAGRTLLSEVLGRFSEGLDVPAVRDARRTVDEELRPLE